MSRFIRGRISALGAVVVLAASVSTLALSAEAEAAETLHLPYITNNKEWRSHVSVVNPSGAQQNLTVYYDDATNPGAGEPLALGPYEKKTLSLRENWTGSVRVQSPYHVNASVLLRYYPNGVINVAQASSNAAYEANHNPRTQVVVPVVHRNNSVWNSLLRVLNTTHDSGTGTIQYRSNSGVSCAQTFSLQPRKIVYVDTRDPRNADGSPVTCLPDNFAGTAIITASKPISVVSLQFATGYKAMIASLALSPDNGADGMVFAPLLQHNNWDYKSGFISYSMSLSGDLKVEYFNTRHFNKTSNASCGDPLVVQNAGWPFTVPNIAFFMPRGHSCAAALSGVLSIPPTSSLRFPQLQAQINQIKNTSTGDIHASGYPAIILARKSVTVPQLYNGVNENGLKSGLQVMNTSTASAQINVTFRHANGVALSPVITETLAPRQSVTMDIPASLTDGSAEVTNMNLTGGVAVVVNHMQTQGTGDVLASHAVEPQM
jgi:hypothetical protein